MDRMKFSSARTARLENWNVLTKASAGVERS